MRTIPFRPATTAVTIKPAADGPQAKNPAPPLCQGYQLMMNVRAKKMMI